MMSLTWILAVILALATALPLENAPSEIATPIRNSVLEQLFLDILEDFRETMLTGSEGLPVLDPFNLDHLHLELDDIGLAGSHVTVDDVEARQLSTFIIDNLEITMISLLLQRYTIEIEGHIPVIEIDSDSYDLSVTAMGFHIFGTGDAKIKIIEPKITATLEAGISLIGGISINLRDAHVVFGLTGFEAEITGIFHNDIVNDFINALLRNLVPDLVEYFEAEITEFLSALVLEVGNDIIGGIIDLTSPRGRDIAMVMMLPAIEASNFNPAHFEGLVN